jgi:hypothetical protein
MTGAVGAVAHARRGSFMYGVHSVCVQCVFGIQCVSVKIEFVGALFHWPAACSCSAATLSRYANRDGM